MYSDGSNFKILGTIQYTIGSRYLKVECITEHTQIVIPLRISNSSQEISKLNFLEGMKTGTILRTLSDQILSLTFCPSPPNRNNSRKAISIISIPK